MKIGVKRRTVKVVDYDFNWLNEYIKEETVLKKILSNYDVDIQHIGSTSIIGCTLSLNDPAHATVVNPLYRINVTAPCINTLSTSICISLT